jgi:N-acetylmuramoyl-L-alanine amidase
MRAYRFAAISALLSAVALSAVIGARQATARGYTVISAAGSRPLPARTFGRREMVPLDRLAALFGFTVTEDAGVGGLTVRVKNQRILLLPGQAFAQVAGRVVPLSGPVERERTTWYVPIDFLSEALGPTLETPITIRRDSRLVLVGSVRVPRVTGRVERRPAGARLVFDIDPAAPHRVTREGRALVIQFEADHVEFEPLTDLPKDFVANVRLDRTAIRVDLGPAAVTFEANTERDQARLALDVLPAPPPPPPPPPRTGGAPPDARPPDAPADPNRPAWLRTLVIDPGHGGDDAGSRGAGGATEKDLVLQIAKRLKAAIDTRWGLRVLLTREGDEAVPLDQRTALANNNKADLFVSLHVNASVRPGVRGFQVLALNAEDYKDRATALATRTPPVPVVGGGFRSIDPVPWEIAQLPFADRSAAFGDLVARHLTGRGVTPHTTPVSRGPLRVLVGAHMPAILIELGFLTNPDDERALTSAEIPGAIVEAILSAIAEVRSPLEARPVPES